METRNRLLRFAAIRDGPTIINCPAIDGMATGSTSVSTPVSGGRNNRVATYKFCCDAIRSAPSDQSIRISSSATKGTTATRLAKLRRNRACCVHTCTIGRTKVSCNSITIFQAITIALPIMGVGRVAGIAPSSTGLCNAIASTKSNVVRQGNFY